MNDADFGFRSATPWIAEPESLEDTQRELRLVLDELTEKYVDRRVLTDQILELESDRAHLLGRIEVMLEQRLGELDESTEEAQ